MAFEFVDAWEFVTAQYTLYIFRRSKKKPAKPKTNENNLILFLSHILTGDVYVRKFTILYTRWAHDNVRIGWKGEREKV